MSRYIAIIIGLLFTVELSAQLQNELLTITQRDYNIWNPAAIATDGRPVVGILYKDVNLGLEQSPLQYLANYQLPVRFQNTAFSATLTKDFLADIRQNKLSLGYRYSIFNHRLDDQRFYLGLSVDFRQDKLLAGNHFARDVDDPLALSETENAYGIDFNVGLYYQLYLPSSTATGDQKFKAGISVSRLRAKDVVYFDDNIVSNRPRHVFGMFNYIRELGLLNLDVKYYLSVGAGNTNHAFLVSLTEVYFMRFSLGYSTTQDLILSWGFDLTDFDDSEVEVDLSLYYGLDDILDRNRNGVQVTVRYLFAPKPWTTSDFR
jgi:hypothetical protein